MRRLVRHAGSTIEQLVRAIYERGGQCDRIPIPLENVELAIKAGLDVEIFIVDPAPAAPAQ